MKMRKQAMVKIVLAAGILLFTAHAQFNVYAASKDNKPPVSQTQPGTGLPDIKPTKLYFNIDCELIAEIKNLGPGKINRKVYFWYSAELGGAEGGIPSVPLMLFPGSTINITIFHKGNYYLHAGPMSQMQKWTLQTDWKNEVAESDEGNNIITSEDMECTRLAKINPAETTAKPPPHFGSKLKQERTPVEMQAMSNDSPPKSKIETLPKGPKVGSGQIQVKSGTPGFGRQPGQKMQPLAPTQVGRLGAIPKIKKPSLWFDTSKPIAKTTVELNKSFGASLSVKNIGEVANDSGMGKKVNLVTTCIVLSVGGKCTKVIAPPMPEIAPGQTKSVGHLAMFVIKKHGDYKVIMSIEPNQPVAGRRQASLKSKWEWNISLKSKLKVKPTPIKRTTTLPGASEPQPASGNGSNGGVTRRIIRAH